MDIGNPKNLVKRQEPLKILLTGAASLVGGAILQNPLDRPQVDRVYCIAVAGNGPAKLPSSDKITAFTGSLLQRLQRAEGDCM